MNARHAVAAAVLCTVVATAIVPVAHAEPVEKGVIGVGLILGEPTGISAKLYLKDDRAIQGAVGAAFVGGGIHVHGDYVWHPWILEERDSFTIPVYLGPGLRVVDYRLGRSGDTYIAVGARAVAGLLFDFKEVPLDAFVEVAGVAEYGFSSHGFDLMINAGAG
ncbi:MAG TPA: hypothetical protein PLF40_25450, partial [Kofleriaceae bacterium]|nr:hypothetical protein [Kofleriaceae bacterium]